MVFFFFKFSPYIFDWIMIQTIYQPFHWVDTTFLALREEAFSSLKKTYLSNIFSLDGIWKMYENKMFYSRIYCCGYYRHLPMSCTWDTTLYRHCQKFTKQILFNCWKEIWSFLMSSTRRDCIEIIFWMMEVCVDGTFFAFTGGNG